MKRKFLQSILSLLQYGSKQQYRPPVDKTGDFEPFTDLFPSCFPNTEQVCTIIRVIVVHTGNIVNIYVYKVKNIYGTSIDKGNAQL